MAAYSSYAPVLALLNLGGLWLAAGLALTRGENAAPTLMVGGADFVGLGLVMLLANPLRHTSGYFRFWLALTRYFKRGWWNKNSLYFMGAVPALLGGFALFDGLSKLNP
jgi:hypothetical protein